VVVRAPVRMPFRDIDAFVQQRASWVRDRLATLAAAPPVPVRLFADGEHLLLDGERIPLEVVPEIGRQRARTWLDAGRLRLETPVDATPEQRRGGVERWYRARLVERATSVVRQWAEVMGVRPAGLIVRDLKRRWGSCSPTGVIRLNWRLAMMPAEVFEYVAVHELSHLRQRNHSPAFWAEVERWLPAHRERRAALRDFERRIDW
jgi:predicted metal-dependent hydrolase